MAAWLIFRARAGVDWRHLVPGAATTGGSPVTVLLSGDALAPALVDRLAAAFVRDHPELTVTRQGGGTNAALERVINRQSDLGLTVRPPTAAEQRLARGATGDTLLVHRVALGAVIAWQGGADSTRMLTTADIGRLALAGPVSPFERLVVPDPNDGTWAALLAVAAPGTSDTLAGPAVSFVPDAAAVLAAVRGDPGAFGITGWLAVPEPAAGAGVHAVPIARPGEAPAWPTYEKIGAGEYPLVHYLHVVARPGGGTAATMFLAYLVGDDGQRQIERAGWLPARRALRTVVLSTDPIGESR